MVMKFGQNKANKNPYRYVYDNPNPDKATFIGRWKNNVLEPNPKTQWNPRTHLVALSANGYNKYPDPSKGYRLVKPADEIKDESKKLIGWAFRYTRNRRR